MGVETVTNLATLNQQQVTQMTAILTQLIQEFNPAIDLKSGVYHDQVLELMAVLQTADQTNVNLVMQSSSLLQITNNPALADKTVVNNLLSNYGIVRNPGAPASGYVTIVLSQLIGVVIPAGSVFIINGLSFAPLLTYAARTSSGAVVAPTDVLVTQLGAGQYAFTIPVTALLIGTAGNVTLGTTATPAVPPPKFVSAYVQNTFTSGLDAQTNAELISLLAQGLAIKAWSNRVSIEALIRKQPAFANIENLSIIGFGDPEMMRDQHAIWPGSSGGRTDVYLRSQPLYQTAALNVTASLVSKTGPLGTWQFSLNRDAAPGLYQVVNILLPSEPLTDVGFVPLSTTWGFNLSGVVDPPDIISAIEATYSRYSTVIVQFQDTVTDATALPLSTQSPYVCIVQAMPLISDIQDFLLGRSVRPPMCDVEVKAPIPCLTTVYLTVNYNSATPAPSVTAIQNAVANAVNALNFSGSLSASFISGVLFSTFTNLVSVINFLLVGLIINPDQSTTTIFDTSVISIANNYPLMVSGRTVAFFLEPHLVAVTLIAVDVPHV